jgi:hypothetical protein
VRVLSIPLISLRVGIGDKEQTVTLTSPVEEKDSGVSPLIRNSLRWFRPARAAFPSVKRCTSGQGADMLPVERRHFPIGTAGPIHAPNVIGPEREAIKTRRGPHRIPREQSMRFPFLLASCWLVLACASAQNAPVDALKPTAVDRPASIISCTDYDASLPLTYPNLVRIRLQFVVRPDGTVDPGSIRLPENTSAKPSTAYLERARRAARGCIFEPGELAGIPVRSWKSMTFGFQSRD